MPKPTPTPIISPTPLPDLWGWLVETLRQQVAQGTSERVLNADGSVKYEYPDLTEEQRASGRFPLAGMEIGNVD